MADTDEQRAQIYSANHHSKYEKGKFIPREDVKIFMINIT